MDAEMMIIISEQRDAARFKSGARCECYVCAISSFGPFSGYLSVWLSMIRGPFSGSKMQLGLPCF